MWLNVPITVDANGKAVLVWEVNSDNLTEATKGGNEDSTQDEMEFYFTVGTETSEDLLFTYNLGACDLITICSDCTQTLCGNCVGVAAASVPNYINCAEAGYNCRCEWDEILGCVSKWDGIETDPDTGTDLTIGTCTYITDSSIDPLGCEDDGHLSYGWQGGWEWDVGNTYTPEPNPNNGDYVEYLVGSGDWHYDPNNKEGECEPEGITTVICSAQIELPFFGTWGIIITIGLIGQHSCFA